MGRTIVFVLVAALVAGVVAGLVLGTAAGAIAFVLVALAGALGTVLRRNQRDLDVLKQIQGHEDALREQRTRPSLKE